MRALATGLFVLLAASAAAQEQHVIPTWVHTDQPVQERVCQQTTPCDPVPQPCPPLGFQPAGCTHEAHPQIHYEMRSKPLFWTGIGLIGGGATLVIGSMTWARESDVVNYQTAPCGTDPFLTDFPIAPCKTSAPLLAAGLSMAGSGAFLAFYGGQRVAFGADGRQVIVKVRF